MTRTKTPLEMAAMMIVLESSNKITKSSASTAYVRQKLIGDLEKALRDAGWNMDSAIQSVLDAKKKERREYQAKERVREAEERAQYPFECDHCYRMYPIGRSKAQRYQDGRCNSCGKPLGMEVTS